MRAVKNVNVEVIGYKNGLFGNWIFFNSIFASNLKNGLPIEIEVGKQKSYAVQLFTDPTPPQFLAVTLRTLSIR